MSHRYDAIIVGAGPSGWRPASPWPAGLSVLILQNAISCAISRAAASWRRDPPRRSARCWASGRGQAHAVRSRGCRLFYHGSLIAAVDEEPEFVSVARSALDAALLEAAAAAGCEVREACRSSGSSGRIMPYYSPPASR